MAILKRVSKKTGKPAYQVLVDVERIDPVTGGRKRQRQTVGTYPTKRQAEAEERKAITERDRGSLLAPTTATVGDVLDAYLATEVPKTVAVENRQVYEVIVNKHLRPALGAIRVQKLRAEHVDRLYTDLLAKGYSGSLLGKVHMRLAVALRLAVRWGLVGRAVTDDVKPPRVATKPKVIWSPAETMTFIDTARRHGDPWLAVWAVLADTGARVSEVLGISWRDIDLDAGTVTLGVQVVRLNRGTPFVRPGGKTAAARRTVRLASPTVALLKTHRTAWLAAKLAAADPAWNVADLTFVSTSGRPIDPAGLRRRFDAAVKRAGLPTIAPHSLRRGAITSALAAGATVKSVAGRAGHSDPAVTIGIYASMTDGQEAHLHDIVEALMTATPTPTEAVGEDHRTG